MKFVSFSLLALLSLGTVDATELRLIGSNVTAPAGSTVQVSFYASPPAPILKGQGFLSFDPGFFRGIQSIAAFSANGDACGAPTIAGTALEIDFSSASAGVGRLPDLPVFTVDVITMSAAQPGAKSTFGIDTSAGPWLDANGNPYTVTVVPGSVTVGGSLAVTAVLPGGGLQPAGATVTIFGSGFDPASHVSLAGVAISSSRIVSDRQIQLTLAAPAELQGKPLDVRNSAGEEVLYFPALQAESRPGHEILFPLQTGTFASFGPAGWAVQSVSSNPVSVATETLDPFTIVDSHTFVLNSYGNVTASFGGLSKYSLVNVAASAPSRMVASSGALDPGTLYPTILRDARPVPLSIGSSASLLNFAVPSAAAAPVTQQVKYGVTPGSPFQTTQISVTTQSGANWLAVSQLTGAFNVTANPAGLAPGTYLGTVHVLASANGVFNTNGDLSIPVRLEVGAPANPPPLTAYPPSIDVPLFAGGTSGDQISITSGSLPAGVQVKSVTSNGNWLHAGNLSSAVTPAQLQISVDGTNLSPGVYTCAVVFTSAAGDLNVPVTATVVPPYAVPPFIGSVVNAASQSVAALSSGELVTLFGTALSKAQILINGSPAQILYASAGQLNVVVPDLPASASSLTITAGDAPISVPVTASDPAIFTLSGTGLGQAAVLNQDSSVNGPANPALRGSVIQIFGTGLGTAASPDVHVLIGGFDAPVTFAGQAPGAARGLLQVNAIVPSSVPAGPATPILLKIGTVTSHADVIIATN